MCTVSQAVSAGMLFGCVWSTLAADNAMTFCCIASLYYTCYQMPYVSVSSDLMLVSAGADSEQPQHCQRQEEH